MCKGNKKIDYFAYLSIFDTLGRNTLKHIDLRRYAL